MVTLCSYRMAVSWRDEPPGVQAYNSNADRSSTNKLYTDSPCSFLQSLDLSGKVGLCKFLCNITIIYEFSLLSQCLEATLTVVSWLYELIMTETNFYTIKFDNTKAQHVQVNNKYVRILTAFLEILCLLIIILELLCIIQHRSPLKTN